MCKLPAVETRQAQQKQVIGTAGACARIAPLCARMLPAAALPPSPRSFPGQHSRACERHDAP